MNKHGGIMVAALILGGCALTPEIVFNDMKKAACTGDVQGFFKRINRTRMTEAFLSTALDTMQKEEGPPGSKELATEIIKSKMDSSAQKIFTEWEDEIKKGEAGYLCKMTFVSSTVDPSGAKAQVFWKTASGKDTIYEMEKFGDRWMVVAQK